ncbi:hypothetical protein KCN56_23115 [Photobacterium galatheae]|uniref:Uncharacterized protein n=1 Tax=Photobacterium galatheae TaxID=1654360 RepID=A0A066RQ49_9GAMM|nr:hypothetical protein [Photobacterium galatheae]KDM89802.1 hypothetical protein EA58_20330 [Photobacterium galatheae]MCM0151452.1 hypothetical protein [Photobacterium galatheae]
MINNKIKIKNLFILILISLVTIGVLYYYSLSQKTILTHETIIAQYSHEKIDFIPATSENIKQLTRLSKTGHKKRFLLLENLPQLGFPDSLEGAKSLLLYQPKSYRSQWFLSEGDIKDIKQSTLTLLIQNSILSTSRSNKVHLTNDNKIIIDIRDTYTIYVIENEQGNIIFNVYSQFKSFADQT